MKKSLCAFSAFLLLSMTGQRAHATDNFTLNTQWITQTQLTVQAGMSESLNNSLADERRRKEGYKDEEEADEESGPPLANLTYDYSAKRRSENLAKFKLGFSQKNVSEDTKAMYAKFVTPEVFSAVDAKFKSAGMNSANIADVYALLIAASWQAANSVPDADLPEVNIVAVAKQLNRFLETQQGLALLADEEKQLLAESLVVQILFIAAVNHQGKADVQSKEAGQALGQGILKAMGFDHTKFKITSEGYKPL
jgi:hypothetical protein